MLKETISPKTPNETVKKYLLKSLKPQQLKIDKSIVNYVVDLGYQKNFILKSLDKSMRNYATTAYYLLAK